MSHKMKKLKSRQFEPLILHSIIISFVAAWLARVLLSFKRTQSSGNDDVDEGQKTPLLCIKDYYVPE